MKCICEHGKYVSVCNIRERYAIYEILAQDVDRVKSIVHPLFIHHNTHSFYIHTQYFPYTMYALYTLRLPIIPLCTDVELTSMTNTYAGG